MLFIIELILLLIGLIGVIIAIILDIKTTEVPDSSNYFMIFSGFVLRIIYSINSGDWNFTIFAVKTFVIIFIISLFMYKTNQWGGGDSKLLMGLSVLFATYPSFLLSYFSPKIYLNLPLVIFINILIVGVVYSFIWSLILAVKNKDRFLKRIKVNLDKKRKIKKQVYLISAVLLLISIFTNGLLQASSISLAVLLAFLFFTYIYLKTVEEIC